MNAKLTEVPDAWADCPAEWWAHVDDCRYCSGVRTSAMILASRAHACETCGADVGQPCVDSRGPSPYEMTGSVHAARAIFPAESLQVGDTLIIDGTDDGYAVSDVTIRRA